jgi:hypothetical protein
MVFENRVLRRVLGPKRDEVTEGCRGWTEATSSYHIRKPYRPHIGLRDISVGSNVLVQHIQLNMKIFK